VNLFTRALLYTTRKRGKSLLLFLILLVMATFSLAGLSVKEASSDAALNLRQSLGGGFKIERDTSNPAKWEAVKNADGSTSTVYRGAFLNREMTEKVMTVHGITGHNSTVHGYGEIKTLNRTYLSPVVFEDDIMRMTGNPGFEHAVTVMGQSNTQYSSYFVNGSFELLEGKHIRDGDDHTAMISRELAEQNHLSVGDKFIVSLNEYLVNDPVGAKSEVEVEIIGIFDPVQKQASQGFTIGINAVENLIFMDIDSSSELYAWANEGYGSAEYYVGDPGQLDNIIEQAKKIDVIDWSEFKITATDKAYQSVSKPLTNLSSLISTLIIIILIISAATLSLILAMWIKNRIYETGILLSIGINKFKIIMQYTVEILIVAIISFGLSYFSSNAVAQNVGDALLEYTSSKATTEGSGQPNTSNQQFYTDTLPEMEMSSTALAKIHVKVDPMNLLWLNLFGSIIIVLTVVIASIPVMQLKPKEILTKMS